MALAIPVEAPAWPQEPQHFDERGHLRAEFWPRRLDGKSPDSRSAGDPFQTTQVDLQPYSCGLGPAGQWRSACAAGVWLGTLQVERPAVSAMAAELLLPLLSAVVTLHPCGVFVDSALPSSALRFLPVMEEEEEELPRSVAEILKPPHGEGLRSYQLTGHRGQVLSHTVNLWMLPDSMEGRFTALLRLEPFQFHRASGSKAFCLTKQSPMGPLSEAWCEVPMVEQPELLRLMMTGSCGGAAGSTTLAHHGEHEEDKVVIHCWRRQPCLEEIEVEVEVADKKSNSTALGAIDQLLWHDALAAVAETGPCFEVPVPAARLRLEDEGCTTWDELVHSRKAKAGFVPPEDAARLASLAFLSQYVTPEVMEAEVLPRLLPSRTGSVRIWSASLADVEACPAAASRPRPSSLDDLFLEDADFCTPHPWASCAAEGEEALEDPLAKFDFTSVFLLGEGAGFLLAFHCLQAADGVEE